MTKSRSEQFFEIAERLLPGGVNSPVRAFRSVGGIPRFIDRAAGSRIYDVDGREYIDYVGSWGPMILGHAHPQVQEAIRKAVERGTSYGAPTVQEIELARRIIEAFPSLEKIRMVSSGTEATMSAIRLARGCTGREKILKFEGCYHGHADSLLVKAGSGIATLGIPGSPGVPACLAELTITLPFNSVEAFRTAVDRYGKELACVIVEPVAGNMGVVEPLPGFLETLRELTRQAGILLIFDEVITGFRLTYGGYQNLCGIEPDLTCLGKIIGGGLPVGAFGGRRDLMDYLAPVGPVYQAGTLSGNPLAMAAGLATLDILSSQRADYDVLNHRTAELCAAMGRLFQAADIPVRINRAGSLFTLFFSDHDVVNYETASLSNTDRYALFFKGMLERGIYLAPSAFEAAFVSFAHSEKDLEETLSACAETIKTMKGGI
ncbi:glutamate-1-semialdehyde 2,1-aminomutase [Syntrophus gentianae]|uniref:Glutamate-1-semialdehyde 2,1-aminomutase n=1 Tax=Syntrophus gentianae TaxID=43775 RepID=A0A1H7Z6Q1_9BACT|nr:glutamate-1-semialdehyde 2,1-aminomutase [Syntrophus gentianae]SEM53238.1 glutamate-1-semialdehyde 2,1-aminomutase [Syntrophus gentianae]